ncbi:MAG: hypothetical protein KF869_02010 [Phycisphaeraceae bacterium]|nr:hypothetical protein [Phycisphaeraceae bacterium]
MESFRLVCRDARGEWYMHDVDAANALAAFEAAAAMGLSPHVVIPARLGRGNENAIVQRWKQGGVDLGECLHCEYELRGLVRAADGLAVCPECGVGAIMRPAAPEPETPTPIGLPRFKPGATFEIWGLVFGVLGFLFFPLAILGIALGVFAYEHSSGLRGVWAMRIGTGALVVGVLIFFAGRFF